MSSPTYKTARMELKTTDGFKQMLTKAAALSGLDLSSFVLGCAEQRARQVIEHHELLALSVEEQQQFYQLLSDPPATPQKLADLLAQEPLKGG